MKKWSEFYAHESCGKCAPCREGTYWYIAIYARLENGKVTNEDIETLLDLSDNILGRAFCVLGDGAVSPVTSSIKDFLEEYQADLQHRAAAPQQPEPRIRSRKATHMSARPKASTFSTLTAKRVYDEPTDDDGTRVLADRLWPRGLSRSEAHFDEWCKDIAPSTELRRWYGHDRSRFQEFSRRYIRELEQPERHKALGHLRKLADAGTVTLLTATKDLTLSHVGVLINAISSESSTTPPPHPHDTE